MDMKESLSNRFHLRRRKGDTREMAARLAPLEEQNGRAAKPQSPLGQLGDNGGALQEVGAIVVDNTPGPLSNDIMDSTVGKTFLGMEPVVLVILAVMLAFIGFIAWQVSTMPAE